MLTKIKHDSFKPLAIDDLCLFHSSYNIIQNGWQDFLRCCGSWREYNGGLVQERRNSIANALELCLSCTKPSIWWTYFDVTMTCVLPVPWFNPYATTAIVMYLGLGCNKTVNFSGTAWTYEDSVQISIWIIFSSSKGSWMAINGFDHMEQSWSI